MDIERAKAEIARRVFNAGYTFDPDEIIVAPLKGKTVVCLQSVRALRTIERDDGTFELEEFNKPIIWIDMPSPLLTSPVIEGTSIRYTVYASRIRMAYPEFAIILP